MNIPGFDAELSLSQTGGIYRDMAGFGGSGMGEVSMQQLGSLFLTTFECCKYDPSVNRVVCLKMLVSPFDNCSCLWAPGGGPRIDCRPGDIPVVDITQSL